MNKKEVDRLDHIVVIGGGITGLSAAWYLQTGSQRPFKITLVEGSPALGGKMTTRKIVSDGGSFIIDAGPEVIVTRKSEAWQLSLALGLEKEIVNPGSETKNIYVLDGGKPKKIPLSPLDFIGSDLLSFGGKLRMLMEPFIPPKRDYEDESLANFVTRRLGSEALEKMLGPVLAGIYNTDPETQSIMTTSPIMREMERVHGGLFRGVLGRMRAKKAAPPGDSSRPRFMTFRNGVQELIDELEAQLVIQILKGSPALLIRKNAPGYKITLAGGKELKADAVILATPANQSGKMLSELAPECVDQLERINHENIGTATLIYKSGQIDLPYAINGLMIPRRESRRIDAVTWTTNKPLVRAPEGFEMLRVFFGGSDPSVVNLAEEEIIQIIQVELEETLDIKADPVQTAVFRWPESFPQAYVNHLDLVDGIEASLPAGIFVAGSSYRGIGVPDCVRQGKITAVETINYLNGN